MDPHKPRLNLRDHAALNETCNGLRDVDESLRRVQMDISHLSSTMRLFYPEGWKDPRWPKSDSPEDGYKEWRDKANSSGLFESKDTMEEELERLIHFREELNALQCNLQRSANEISPSQTRSLHIFDMPNEILIEIFEWVEGFNLDYPRMWPVRSTDIMSVRLTCRRFCSASSSLLLRSIHVDFRLSSLERLEEISRHPDISRGMRAVRAVLRFYDEDLSGNLSEFALHQADELRRQIDTMERCKMWEWRKIPEETGLSLVRKARSVVASWRKLASDAPAEMFTEDDHAHRMLLESTHREYQRLFNEQESLRRDGRFSKIVASAMARMPRARRLELLDWDASTIKASRSLYGLEDSFTPVYKDMLRPMDYSAALECGFTPRLTELLLELPIAIQKAGVWLESIDINLSYLEHTSQLVPSPEQQRQLSSAVQKLKRFSFQCRNFSDWEGELDERDDNLCEFFTPCLDTRTLEQVDLQMINEEGFDYVPMVSMGRVLTSRTWQNLLHLDLTEISLHLAELQALIEGLEKPLQSMTLTRILLLSGTWAEALDALRENANVNRRTWLEEPLGAECENLSEAELSRIFDKKGYGPVLSNAELYIRGYYSKNPLRCLEIERDATTEDDTEDSQDDLMDD